jgi:hypothetical protein
LTLGQAHVRVPPYAIVVSLLQISNILVTNSVALAPAASWWMMFGSSTPALQKLAVWLVSQCVSSSGCERNWSTFALLHTKVRNRLTHKKMNKLVYVNYNLHLRLKDVSTPSRDEGDFIDHLAHLSFYDEHHPVREWFEYGRSNQEPVLDEDDHDDRDVPLPSHLVSDHGDPSDLRETMGDDCISDWARRVVGDSHLGKRKFQEGPKKGDPKRQQGKGKTTTVPVDSDTSTDDGDGQRSPPYQESEDSSSTDDDDGDGDDSDGDGGDGGGGDGAGASGGGVIRFTSIH